MHLNSGKLNLLVIGFLHHSSTRRHRHRATGKNWETHIPALVDVPARAIDNNSTDSFGFRGERQKPAPTRRIRSSAVIDHDHFARLSCIDGQRSQVVLWFVQAYWFDLHRHRAPDNLRAWP